jgi:hypothetical protein
MEIKSTQYIIKLQKGNRDSWEHQSCLHVIMLYGDI